MSTTHEVKMVTHYQDNGDGSSTTTFYGSLDELKREKIDQYGWDEEQWQELLDNYDPYNNGSIDYSTLKVTINDDGTISVGSFSCYSGNQ